MQQHKWTVKYNHAGKSKCENSTCMIPQQDKAILKVKILLMGFYVILLEVKRWIPCLLLHLLHDHTYCLPKKKIKKNEHLAFP